MATIIGINNNNKLFKPGDFITFTNKEGSFAIYEGIDIATSRFKKLTVILSYDPNKYVKTEEGYKMCPSIETSTKLTNCETTVDTNEETYWVRKCNEDEIKEALKIMKEFGYDWNENDLSVIDAKTKSIITKIHIPKIEYKGQIIKPTPSDLKQLLKTFCIEKNKNTAYYSNSLYSRYWEGWGYDDYLD